MYIRTKDCVYEVLSEYPELEDTTLISNYERAFDVKVTPRTFKGASIRIIYERQIIKQAETIEELCDEFVVNFEIFNRSYYFIYENSYDELKSDVQTFNYSAYGAVWTDKGLIYVAKMNSDGKLELI